MSAPQELSLDVQEPEAVPYFNWDVPVTNRQLRETLSTGSLEDRLPWMARVLREASATLVDLVIDRGPQLVAVKPFMGAIRVDDLDEIGANKIRALLGQVEIRDLVDLRALVENGHAFDELLARARLKEGGVEPAALA